MRKKTLSTRSVQLLLVSCMLLLMGVGAWAQSPQTIKGTVLDKNTHEPMIGVSVLVQGTSNGTVTDFDGHFTLSGVKASATIQFSFIGYKSQSLPVAKAHGEILMSEDDKTLSEIVVVGYGTQKKVNLSGAVSAVDGEKLAAKPSSNVLDAMQGELPGVAVLRSSGEPGNETSGMRIRGFSSVNSTSTLVRIVVSPSEAVSFSSFPTKSNNTSSRIGNEFLLLITRLTACNCEKSLELEIVNFICVEF